LSWLAITRLINSAEDNTPVVDTSQPDTRNNTPRIEAVVVTSGLDHPWEVAFLPDNTMLFTERGGVISKLADGKKVVIEEPDDVVVRGEGGMMGLAVDPDYQSNRYIYACFNSSRSGLDIRVVRWRLNESATSASERTDIVTGMPAASSGRHSGCRIGFGLDRNLWIGTGDAARGGVSQDLSSLGGKILRVDRDGKGVDGNLGGQADPRIYSYGHRNTQGLAFYSSIQNGSYGVSVEHGSSVDDEVNPLVKGNFGWNPPLPYDESVPMTDTQKFPEAVKSIWNSGDPTIAPSDAAFLTGNEWGKWQDRLAMGVLKDQHLRLLELKPDGTTGEQLKVFDHAYGRIRAVTLGPDSVLYISTDNGAGQDQIVRLTPKL